MDAKRKGLIGALLLGLLSGPAVALAAAGAFGGGGEAAAAPVVAAVTTAAPSTTSTTQTTEIQATEALDARADMVTACTVDGPALVDAETGGTITDVEQAALDALRDICGSAGMSLDDPPAADPGTIEVVEVRTVTVSAAAPTTTQGGEGEYEEHEDDDEDDDGQYEEHEDDESHEYEGEDD